MSEEAITQIADETNELWFSVASIWEIGIKVAIANCNNEHYWQVYFDTNKAIRETFGEAGYPLNNAKPLLFHLKMAQAPLFPHL
ncbi:MAG TPA: hypothetical protein V6D25_08665 [Leptolyngbyaceae cyanobacterium]